MVTLDSMAARATDTGWIACRRCGVLLYRKRFTRLSSVCPECGWHGPLTAEERARHLFGDSFRIEHAPGPAAADDPLSFTDLLPYPDRLRAARSRTGMDDAVLVVRGRIQGRPLVAAIMDFRFLGGSLGSAAGEAVTAAAELALADRCALLLVTASGGARMQEGALSLMQMAKTSNAMAALDEAGLLTITLVTDPTYGGVAASFATLSDIVLAEPKARLGFAGPRVIEQTIRQQLPKGFQTAEFLLSHGLVDDVVPRTATRHVIGALLAATGPAPAEWGAGTTDPTVHQPEPLAERPVREVIRAARDVDRPTTTDHLALWGARFVELHGDRLDRDCPAIVGGLATIEDRPCVVIGHQKGHNSTELARRGFGMPSPAGYRKAERLMRLAGKLRIPVVTLIDTPGAHPGIEAEEKGQANAIAACLRTMGGLPVPVVAVITGEGGSGGALALGVADRVLACENAVYSVISPEGCAAILWKDSAFAETAAEALRIDAPSLLRLGIADGIVPEPPGGAHKDPTTASLNIRDAVVAALRGLDELPARSLVGARRARFRGFGTARPAESTDRGGAAR
ncbi:carboxyltransferase subunit alpha [Nocardiopsis mangrovi]|uniref:Multifunctional fusion protein n=1 Tax=Nocardiopsis mangrovi TaxID=1179818 RepID=A0ABV9E3H6_9ACTN